MTMTSENETTVKKRGRPFGVFGPRRRQKQLIDELIRAFGGAVTPIRESSITRAVMLQSIAEEKRREINKHGAKSANELLALARLEEVAEAAVRQLKLPMTAVNTTIAEEA
jgi:hypothetical protein